MGRPVKYTNILDRAKSIYRAGRSAENAELIIRGHAEMTNTDPESTVQAFREWAETEGKEYRREARKKTYERHKEKIKANAREYYKTHQEERKAYDKIKRNTPEYKEKAKEWQKAWRERQDEATREKWRAYQKEYYRKHKAERLSGGESQSSPTTERPTGGNTRG